MQIKTTLRYHLTPVRIVKIKTQATADDGEEVEQGERSSIAGGTANLYNHFGSQCGFLRKLGINLPQDQVIPLLGIYTKDAQAYHKDTCSTMLITVLFCNSQNLETTQTCLNQGMDEENVVH